VPAVLTVPGGGCAGAAVVLVTDSVCSNSATGGSDAIENGTSIALSQDFQVRQRAESLRNTHISKSPSIRLKLQHNSVGQWPQGTHGLEYLNLEPFCVNFGKD
jgi:hypothetical protein